MPHFPQSPPKPSADVEQIFKNYQQLVALKAMTIDEVLLGAFVLGHLEGQIVAWEENKRRMEEALNRKEI